MKNSKSRLKIVPIQLLTDSKRSNSGSGKILDES